MYFLFSMILGVLVSITSNNWLGAWLGLELNLISFIPFLMSEHKAHSEASSIYFLTQAAGSLVMLMAGLSLWCYELELKFLISVALLFKVGAAPFHFWYVQSSMMMKWVYFLLLSTIQKISPLTLLWMGSTEMFSKSIYISVVMSGVVGGLGGLYSLSMRELLVYSSINHLGWMLIALEGNKKFWMVYLLLYCLMVFLVVGVLLTFSIYHLNQLISVHINWLSKLTFVISMMSLGGLPPLVGFIPKWGVISMVSCSTNLLCLTVLIITSVISLFYYTHASFSILTMNFNNKILLSYNNTMMSGVVFLVSVAGFWTYPMFMSFCM